MRQFGEMFENSSIFGEMYAKASEFLHENDFLEHF
jgi:hypothetical protein